jgi:hypothetical protein
MLNGLDPIIIFEFSKKLSEKQLESLSKIPIVSSIVKKIGLPPIPIYLSEKITGLYIDSEDRTIDIDTKVEADPDGKTPVVNQTPINSVVKINMIGSRNSIGLTLLNALADLIVPKVSSKEYTITYLHGSITIFRGLLHTFSVNQNADTDLVNIGIELTKTNTIIETKPPADTVVVEKDPTSVDLQNSGEIQSTSPTGKLGKGGGAPLKGPPPRPASPPPKKLKGLG